MVQIVSAAINKSCNRGRIIHVKWSAPAESDLRSRCDQVSFSGTALNFSHVDDKWRVKLTYTPKWRRDELLTELDRDADLQRGDVMPEFNDPVMIECYFRPEVAAVIDTLRQEWRVKLDVDYAMMSKYGQLHVFCVDVFRETIEDAFRSAGVEITSVTVLGERSERIAERDDGLSHVVVGRDHCGGHSEVDLFYSVSGQWSDTVDRARRMTLADAQDFVSKYPGNSVRHVRDFKGAV